VYYTNERLWFKGRFSPIRNTWFWYNSMNGLVKHVSYRKLMRKKVWGLSSLYWEHKKKSKKLSDIFVVRGFSDKF